MKNLLLFSLTATLFCGCAQSISSLRSSNPVHNREIDLLDAAFKHRSADSVRSFFTLWADSESAPDTMDRNDYPFWRQQALALLQEFYRPQHSYMLLGVADSGKPFIIVPDGVTVNNTSGSDAAFTLSHPHITLGKARMVYETEFHQNLFKMYVGNLWLSHNPLADPDLLAAGNRKYGMLELCADLTPYDLQPGAIHVNGISIDSIHGTAELDADNGFGNFQFQAKWENGEWSIFDGQPDYGPNYAGSNVAQVLVPGKTMQQVCAECAHQEKADGFDQVDNSTYTMAFTKTHNRVVHTIFNPESMDEERYFFMPTRDGVLVSIVTMTPHPGGDDVILDWRSLDPAFTDYHTSPADLDANLAHLRKIFPDAQP